MPLTSDKRAKFTYDYNIFNNMKCPNLIKDPNSLTAAKAIGGTVRNLSNYAASYPVSGYNTLNNEGSTLPTRAGPFYTGPDYAMGSNYFVPIGKCSEESDESCKGKNRWVYVRNIPTGKNPLFANMRFKDILGCDIQGLTEGRGLVPGIFEDLSDIQPFNLIDNVRGKGNFGDMKCKKTSLPVGAHIYDPRMQCKDPTFRSCDKETWWMEERCTPSFKYRREVIYPLAKIPGAKPIGHSGSIEEGFSISTKTQSTSSDRYIFAILLLCMAVALIVIRILKKRG